MCAVSQGLCSDVSKVWDHGGEFLRKQGMGAQHSPDIYAPQVRQSQKRAQLVTVRKI